MPLKVYKNKKTGEEKRSLKTLPKDEWEELIIAPNQKFMISSNPEKRTSKMKDATKVLTARARNHSRDVDIDDTIQLNLANGLKTQVHKNLLNKEGKRRRKIDDI